MNRACCVWEPDGLSMACSTAWMTGLRTKSSLFGAGIFARFFLVSVPPMVLLAILSMALEQALPVVMVALSFTCLVLLLATQLFYGRIEHRWAGEEFD